MPRKTARLLLFLALLAGCTRSGGAGPEEYQAFATYDEAAVFYLRHFENYDRMLPESRSIAAAIYFPDSRRKVMLVVFRSNPGKIYIHEGIPPSVWRSLQGATSKGGFYDAHIRGQHSFRLE